MEIGLLKGHEIVSDIKEEKSFLPPNMQEVKKFLIKMGYNRPNFRLISQKIENDLVKT